MDLKLHVTLDPTGDMPAEQDLHVLANSVFRRTQTPLEVTLPGGDVVYLKLRQVEITNE